MKRLQYIVFIIVLFVAGEIASEDGFPKLAGSYLGQKTPGTDPEIFAKDLTCRANAFGGFIFSKNGNEVFFFSVEKGKYLILHSEISNGVWQPPKRIWSPILGNELHPFFSADGSRLFFGSDRRIQPNRKVPYSNLWFRERNRDGWSEAKPLPPLINTGHENCGSFRSDGRLYFRRVSPDTRGDIFQTDYLNGKFKTAVKLPGEINSLYDESHPAVSADGSYLIFSSKRPGGFSKGKDELWISFSNEKGEWRKAVNMGKAINNGSNTSCATISPDGRYIFFVRIENGAIVSYWVSAGIVEAMRLKE